MKGETLTNIQDKKSKKKGVGVSLATGLTTLLKEVFTYLFSSIFPQM
jgi:hypothetical protein